MFRTGLNLTIWHTFLHLENHRESDFFLVIGLQSNFSLELSISCGAEMSHIERHWRNVTDTEIPALLLCLHYLFIILFAHH